MPGLREVWLPNTGERNVRGRVRVALSVEGAAVLAYDLLGGFVEEETPAGQGGQLVGPAPAVGRDVMIAWYRFAPGHDEDVGRINLGKVEVVE
jgi:hypothetical protein